MAPGRLTRSRKSRPGNSEVVNRNLGKELNAEMDGFKEVGQIQEILPWKPKEANEKDDKELKSKWMVVVG